MGLSGYCVLFLFFTFAVALDVHLERRNLRHHVFVRNSDMDKGFRISKRSLPAWLAPTKQHTINRRSADQGDTCEALQGYETKLAANTHSHIFNDLSGSVSLAWVGDGTGVILALTTFQLPFLMIKFGQSKLYRSNDYGKTFLDVTELINNTFIRTEFGIAIGPENSGKVIMTGDVSGEQGYRIFASDDFGNGFTQHDLPFIPVMQITYNPRDANVLLVTSNHNQLWLSKDFGVNWVKIHDMVCMVKW
uniref:Sortilin 1 n=1 Tax=Gadus morhua TaxID=8049 RepID=A0A0N7JQK0_GADMO|nr:sortilin 1 [Gadus morhua]